jgi:hypothetical protein
MPGADSETRQTSHGVHIKKHWGKTPASVFNFCRKRRIFNVDNFYRVNPACASG